MRTLTIIISLLISNVCFSQNEEIPKSKPIQQENILDMQANIYKHIWGKSLTNGKDPKDINGFMDLVNASDLTPELKVEAIKQYRAMGGTLEADQKLKKQFYLKVKDSLTINKKT